jgi:hypothetical protein
MAELRPLPAIAAPTNAKLALIDPLLSLGSFVGASAIRKRVRFPE